MKKFIYSIILIIIFIFFSVFINTGRTYKTVLNILSPSIIQVDINNNGVIDANETICIPNIETFNTELSSDIPPFAKTLNLNKTDAIMLGYLAQEYSESLLANKIVKLKHTDKQSPNCIYADLIVDNSLYSDKIYQAGFASKDGNFSKDTILKNLEKAKKLKLVIFNKKSYKYHKLDCKYGVLSSNYIIIPVRQLPNDAKPCKFCHIKNIRKSKINNKQDNMQELNNEIITDGSLKLIYTDFTKILKPDRNCQSTVCKEVVNNINKAKVSIDIAAYGLDKIPALYNALLQAKSRNVVIRLVYDKSFTPENEYYKETESFAKIFNNTSNDYNYQNSTNTNKLMHNKFIIIDNSTVITGSMNFSSTGLSGYNANTIIIIKSREIANIYNKEFLQMLSGKFHNEKQKTGLPNTYVLKDGKVKILFSPYDKSMQHIVKLIDNSKRYVYVPAFLITHNDFTQALINAYKRGVDVKIIVDANSFSTRNGKNKILRASGIPLKAENYAGKMHIKSVIIDDKYFTVGSMNFSNSGENKNDENIVIVENDKLATAYKNYFLYLWQKIPNKYLKNNPRAESQESIGSCNDGIDNDFDGLIDKEDPSCLAN